MLVTIENPPTPLDVSATALAVTPLSPLQSRVITRRALPRWSRRRRDPTAPPLFLLSYHFPSEDTFMVSTPEHVLLAVKAKVTSTDAPNTYKQAMRSSC